MEGSEITVGRTTRWRDAVVSSGRTRPASVRRRWSGLAVATVFALGIAFPFVFSSSYTLQLAGDALALGTWVMGLDVLVGYTGLVSFGHAAWLAIGAYAFGYLSMKGWDALTAFAATVGITAAIAIPLGYVATRTSGLAFAIVTLAEGVIVYTVILHLSFLGGGIGLFGVPFPKIAGHGLLSSQRSLYFFALVLAGGAYLLLRWLLRAPLGSFLEAIRDDRLRARSIGVEVGRYEVASFVIAAVIGAIGGISFIVLNGGIGPTQFDWSQSGLALVILIIGGSRTIYGAVIGAFIYVYASNYLTSSFANSWQVYLGGLFLVLVLVLPGGAVGAVRLVVDRARGRRA